MEKKFKRDVKSLDKIFDYINHFVLTSQLDDSISFSIKFVVEELFTNMIKYNVGHENDILISLKKNGQHVVVELVDYDVEPFDLTKVGDLDITKPLERREVGGLGIHLVKKMVDRINYEYENRTCRITVFKNLG
ncbi:MAG: ATP-binding protein [Ignavibacteriae bacterium]|nr:ATP-binding protein [Ignavibacteriota bacterium]